MKKIAICLGLAGTLLVSSVSAKQVQSYQAKDHDVFTLTAQGNYAGLLAKHDNHCGMRVITGGADVIVSPGVKLLISGADFATFSAYETDIKSGRPGEKLKFVTKAG